MQEQDKKIIDSEQMPLPKGGGAYKGIEDKFETNAFTGEGVLSFPVYATPCRGIEPKLALEYSTIGGNGIFGMGFSLPIISISRKTTKNIPLYDDSDIFIFANRGDLVLQNSAKNAEGFSVRTYCLKKESDFQKIEYFKKESESFWQVTDRNNATYKFGRDLQSRIANPNDTSKVFSWMLSGWEDEKGNKIEYAYNNKNFPDYIRYGNHPDKTGNEFYFEIKFEYSAERKDAIRTYNAGFLKITDLLCTKISMNHIFNGNATKVREMSFSYNRSGFVSLLEKISVTGYKTLKDGSLTTMSLPDTDFTYQPFEPNGKNYTCLETEDNIPFEIDNNNFFFVDLDGEGAPGILYADGKTSLYCRPSGNFGYEAPIAITDFPIHKNLSKYKLIDLEGNGKYQLTVYSHEASGYYNRQGNSWGNFTPFEHIATEVSGLSPYIETADLQGDKQPHHLTAEHGKIHYYPSEKTKGMGAPITKELPNDFPYITQNSPTQAVRFLEITGDGLVHRVLIENGSVEYFPNIGYGNFGEKTIMENAPYFKEGLDVTRLFFADLDGTGTADFIYMEPEKVNIYFNIAGIGFTEPVSIPLPENYTRISHIHFADVNGSGTNCMIFSSITGACIKHYCYDFSSGKKPYMLTQTNYNTGLRTELYYKSSAQLYFNAKETENPWKTPLAFPIQLVVQTKEINEVSETLTVTDYTYKDGIYDYEENKFSGFRFAEKRDSFYYQAEKEASEVKLKKMWFYSNQKNDGEYNDDDKKAVVLEEHILEATDIEHGQKSLWGMPVREEFYEETICAEVKQYRYKTLELNSAEKRKGYFPHLLEQLTTVYEREISDPRIEHELNLETDSFGNVLRQCSLVYPRNKSAESYLALPENLRKVQSCVLAIETESHYANEANDKIYRLGILTEEKKYEYKFVSDKFFSVETLLPELNCENPIEWARFIFWDDLLQAELPLGKIGKRALLHHKEEAVFPEHFEPFKGYIGEEEIEKNGGYRLDGSYWWNRGLVNYYANEWFFLLSRLESFTSYYREVREYDSCALLPVKNIRYIDDDIYNEATGQIDYQAIQYSEIKDINDNITQVIYNPLGYPESFTEHGSCCGKKEGNGDSSQYLPKLANFENLIQNPEYYLQDMTSFYHYDFCAWQERKQPIATVTLIRGNDKSSEKSADISVTINYFDGYGNELEERRLAEQENWAARGRLVYNKDGKEIALYPGFFSNSFLYSVGSEVFKPARSNYDRKGRLTRRENFDMLPETKIEQCFYSSYEYAPWEEKVFDENRNVEDSPYYKAFIAAYPEEPTNAQIDKFDALKKSLAFKEPITKILDGRGNRIAELLNKENLYVRYEYDAKKNIVEFADAKLEQLGKCNLKNWYDMRGRKIRTQSCDAGNSVQLENIFEKAVHAVNGNDIHKTIFYDGLQRVAEIKISGLGVAEKIEYGEKQANSKECNLRGKIYKHFDQAGVEIFSSYTLRGNVREKKRYLCIDYKQSVNWEQNVELEPDSFDESFLYNTANQITEKTTPDGNTYFYQYNRRNFLNSVSVKSNGVVTQIVKSIYYCSGEKRTKIKYGNDSFTKFRYSEVVSSRLEKTWSVRPTKQGEEIIQSWSYIYDPFGNITRIRDNMKSVAYTRGQVTHPYLDYEYDELYRLKSAQGRELAEHQNDFANLVEYKRNYFYDYGGNITKIRHTSKAGDYTVDMKTDSESNRLTSCLKDKDLPAEVLYDSSGNMLNLPHLRSMEWDYDGRLKSAAAIVREDGKNDEEHYVYDSAGKRIRKITIRRISDEQVEETQKIYIGAFSVERSNIASKTGRAMRVTDGETPFATLYYDGDSCSVIYQMGNHLESVCLELNAEAEIVSAQEYFPFGGSAIEWASKRGPPKERQFANKERDIVTGFYYFETRYYSSYLGRFVSADCVDNVKPDEWQSFNLYAYCHNNPINSVDPDGRMESHFEKVKGTKVLKADCIYVKNESEYQTDSSRRIIGVFGTLDDSPAQRSSYAQRKVVRQYGIIGMDDGGHLIASQFGGSGDIDNLVAMNRALNRSGGGWFSMETYWKKKITKGYSVGVAIDVTYIGSDMRPSAFDVVTQYLNKNDILKEKEHHFKNE